MQANKNEQQNEARMLDLWQYLLVYCEMDGQYPLQIFILKNVQRGCEIWLITPSYFEMCTTIKVVYVADLCSTVIN